MFKRLAKWLRSGITIMLINNYRRLSIQLLKIETAKGCLHVLQIARLSTIGLIWIWFVIGLIGVGVLLFHAGLFILLPWTAEVKAVVGMFLGLTYVAIGCSTLLVILNEKTWMKKSGATGMLEEALDPACKA